MLGTKKFLKTVHFIKYCKCLEFESNSFPALCVGNSFKLLIMRLFRPERIVKLKAGILYFPTYGIPYLYVYNNIL
jgi:hypothetical protein